MERRLAVACVLKSGGDYTAEYVNRLRAAIGAHTSVPFEWVCFSDVPEVATHPLPAGLTGWWSKLALFQITDRPVVYFDLDTVIHGSIDGLLSYPHKFAMLSDLNGRGGLASGVMAWHGDYSYLLDRWCMSKAGDYRTPRRWGDQGWIAEQLEHEPERLQEQHPRVFCSHKWDKLETRQQRPVVIYHGNPRPHQTGWSI